MPMIPDTRLRMIDACVTDIVQQTYRIPVANHELVKAMVASILLSRRPFYNTVPERVLNRWNSTLKHLEESLREKARSLINPLNLDNLVVQGLEKHGLSDYTAQEYSQAKSRVRMHIDNGDIIVTDDYTGDTPFDISIPLLIQPDQYGNYTNGGGDPALLKALTQLRYESSNGITADEWGALIDPFHPDHEMAPSWAVVNSFLHSQGITPETLNDYLTHDPDEIDNYDPSLHTLIITILTCAAHLPDTDGYMFTVYGSLNVGEINTIVNTPLDTEHTITVNPMTTVGFFSHPHLIYNDGIKNGLTIVTQQPWSFTLRGRDLISQYGGVLAYGGPLTKMMDTPPQALTLTVGDTSFQHP